ncbi:MAG: TonB-dependent receptor [Hyphomonadaceae bacterium]|nr:TonB-dependent receptor [Hyphomonadaceae bacterium]
MRKPALFAATGWALAAALCHASPAFAQEGRAEASRGQDGEILVTARRVEERLQDVPISVAVLNEQDLANQNIVNAFDLGMRLPSLNATNILGSTSTTFSLRGFVQDIGGHPTVGVYFADVVAPRGFAPSQLFGDGAGAGSFFDLQNVQVLKGPQGTLFGRNTTGGAVLLVPRAPSDEFEGYVEGSLGNYNMRRIQGVLNLPLGERAAVRFGLDAQQRDGYLTNTTGVGPSDFNDLGYISGRASLRLDLTPTLENTTIVTYSRTDQNGDIQQLFYALPSNQPTGALMANQLARAAGAGFYSVQNGLADAGTVQDTWQVINTTNWDVSPNLTVTNIISYAQLTNDLSGSIFGTYADLSSINGFLAGLGRGPIPAGTFAQISGGIRAYPEHSTHQSTFTEELRVSGTALDGRLNFQGGIYTEISVPLDGLAGTFSSGFLLCGDNFYAFRCANPTGLGTIGTVLGKTEYRDTGLYAQGSYSITDALTLTAGFRYTWDVTEGVGVNQRIAFPTSAAVNAPSSTTCTLPRGVPPGCGLQAEQESEAPTWALSLDYRLTPDLMTYVRYSRGYRAGGVQMQIAAPLDTFEQEELDTYEVGLKWATGGDRPAMFNIAGFYNDFTNQQIQVSLLPTVAGLSQLTAIFNTGASTIWGIEVDASVELFEGFTLRGAYAYIDTEITAIDPPPTFVGFPYSISNPARVGDRLRQTPENKLNISADYVLPLDQRIGEVSVGVSYTYVDDQVTNYIRRDASGQLNGFSIIPSRELIDARIDWRNVAGSRFDLSIFATNLADEEYWTYVTDASVLAARQIGQPRMYGARLRYNFGAE